MSGTSVHQGPNQYSHPRRKGSDYERLATNTGRHSTPRWKPVAAIRKVAPPRPPCLITGESGTGNNAFAAPSHRQSSRAWAGRAPSSSLCAAIPENPHRNREFFGHENARSPGRRQARRPLGVWPTTAPSCPSMKSAKFPRNQAKLLRVLRGRNSSASAATAPSGGCPRHRHHTAI